MKRNYEAADFLTRLAALVAEEDLYAADDGGKCDHLLTWVTRQARQQGDWPVEASPPAQRLAHPVFNPNTNEHGSGYEFAQDVGRVWVIWRNPEPSFDYPLNSHGAMCFSVPDDGTLWRMIERGVLSHPATATS